MFVALVFGFAIAAAFYWGKEINEKYGEKAASYYLIALFSAIFAISVYTFKYIATAFNSLTSQTPGTLGAVGMNFENSIGGVSLWSNIMAVLFLISFLYFSFKLIREIEKSNKQ